MDKIYLCIKTNGLGETTIRFATTDFGLAEFIKTGYVGYLVTGLKRILSVELTPIEDPE